MRKLRTIGIFAIIVVAMAASSAIGQKAGSVCGDPTAKCRDRANFQDEELPFIAGTRANIAESAWFYGIVLKSAKMKVEWGDCDNPMFTAADRGEVQSLFPKNKVFALNCVQTGSAYYTGVSDQIAFIGIYAGPTLAAANAFLKKVQATGKYPGIKVRRMKVQINGT